MKFREDSQALRTWLCDCHHFVHFRNLYRHRPASKKLHKLPFTFNSVTTFRSPSHHFPLINHIMSYITETIKRTMQAERPALPQRPAVTTSQAAMTPVKQQESTPPVPRTPSPEGQDVMEALRNRIGANKTPEEHREAWAKAHGCEW